MRYYNATAFGATAPNAAMGGYVGKNDGVTRGKAARHPQSLTRVKLKYDYS